MDTLAKFENFVEKLNALIELNRERAEISRSARGGRGDAFLDCVVDGKKNWKKFCELGTDHLTVNTYKLNELGRANDEKRAEIKKEVRKLVRDFNEFVITDEIMELVTVICQDGINFDFILLNEDDKPRTDMSIKLQKAKNGKGTGVLVSNL